MASETSIALARFRCRGNTSTYLREPPDTLRWMFDRIHNWKVSLGGNKLLFHTITKHLSPIFWNWISFKDALEWEKIVSAANVQLWALPFDDWDDDEHHNSIKAVHLITVILRQRPKFINWKSIFTWQHLNLLCHSFIYLCWIKPHAIGLCKSRAPYQYAQ